MKRFLGLAALTCALVASTVARAGNAAEEFSATSNPNGAWSYGWTDVLGGAFTLFTNRSSSNGNDFWYGNQPPLGGAPGYPTIFHSERVDADMLLAHPGPSGEYAVLRWTAPMDETVLVTLEFSAQDPHPTTTDVHLLVNGTSLLDGVVNSTSDKVNFVQSLSFSQGDVLEFAVGFGVNADYFFDSTGIRATVVTVPEPATISLCLAGLFVVVGAARRAGARSAKA